MSNDQASFGRPRDGRGQPGDGSAVGPAADAPTGELGAAASFADVPVVHRAAAELVGPFRLERPLGRGGFGEVWCATHEALGRRVALKLLRPDRLGQRSLRRFEAERESLRLLAHPNVAKIYDAGTTPDGAPFIAMEFIEGVPLTHYCDRMRCSIAERLRLLATVCDAVHYVHLQGIIHRDLSPDNILVSLSGPEEGQPKIIDFGIARAAGGGLRLSEETVGEGLGHVVGKLMYMSPEQAEAGPGGVDARTDIYALGVILYELLAGVLPIDSETLRSHAFTRAVQLLVEGERPAPAARVRSMAPTRAHEIALARRERDGDALAHRLDSRLRFLPMTAIQPDRSRRFSSAAAMAEDIRAFLDGRDFVQATRDPWWDKSVRHAKRHWVLWGAVALLFLSLSLGVLGTAAGLLAARRNEALAEDRLALSESVITYLTDDLLGSDEQATLPADTTVEELLSSAPERIDRRFGERPAVRARLLGAIGAWAMQTGLREHANEVLESARRAAEEAGADPMDLSRIDLLRSESLWRAGRAEEALALAESAVEALAREKGPLDPLTLSARNQVANAIKHAGRAGDAERLYREILSDRRLALSADHLDTLITEHNLALAIFMQAKAESDAERKRARIDEALAIELPNWERTKRTQGSDHEQSLAAGSEVAAMLQSAGRLEDAERVYGEVVPLMRERLGDPHWRTRTMLANYGRLLSRMGKLDRAVPALDAALAAFKSRVGVAAPDTAVIAGWLAEAYEGRGEMARAEATLIELYEGIISGLPSPERDRSAATQAGKIAELFGRAGNAAQAAAWAEKAELPK